MRQYHRFLWVLSLLCLLLTACNTAKPAPKADPAQVPPAAGSDTNTAVPPDSSRVFPARDWAYQNNFDDGTQSGPEWWLRDQSRVVAANQQGVYAVWYIAPGGIYRRDPLGGPHAPLLQYLPATLADNIAWQQTSGSDVVQFWLRRAQTCGDAGDQMGMKVTTPCWDLEVLNRGQKQRFFFAEGAGVVAASLLAPASPATSYHKQATDRSSKPLPSNRDALLAQADQQGGFAASDIAATAPLTPDQFRAHTQTLLQPTLTTVPMDGPVPVYLLGALGAPVSKPAPLLLDAAGERWQRSRSQETPCTYQAQQQPFRHLLEICGRATFTATATTPTVRVRGWRRKSVDLTPIHWPEHPATTDDKAGMQITAAPDGRVTIQRAVGDPLHHVETIIYLLDDEGSARAQGAQFGLSAAGIVYPTMPEEVLLAAFFARWQNLKDEVPLFFATPATADRLLRLDLPRALGDGSHGVVQIGQLTRVEIKSSYDRAVKVAPAAVVADQFMDFALEDSGCCDSFQLFWGKVQFHQDSAGHWQITRLELLFVQNSNGVKPLPQPN